MVCTRLVEIGCHFTQFQKTLDDHTVCTSFAVWGFTTNPSSRVCVTGFRQAVGLVLEIGECTESINLFIFGLGVQLLELFNLGARFGVLLLEFIDGAFILISFADDIRNPSNFRTNKILLELLNLGTRLFGVAIPLFFGFDEILLELEDVVSNGSGVHVGRHLNCEYLHDLDTT